MVSETAYKDTINFLSVRKQKGSSGLILQILFHKTPAIANAVFNRETLRW